MSNRSKFILLFLFLLALRTLFGFTQPFFDVDETQTFLTGLKCYTTHTWPYFGPDLIVTETGFYTQIPGPLEGLLIGLPLFVWPAPEAPFLLLNLLSLTALALFAKCVSRRVKNVPFLFIFAWIALLPWNLHESTSLINPAWLLFGSILFFMGFLEAVPSLSTHWFSTPWAFALMGFGLFWNMQFHFSWILLLPFVAASFFFQARENRLKLLTSASGFLLGLLPVAALLLPTFLKYGWSQGAGGTGTARLFCPDNFLAFFTVLARYFSLASFEIPRFIGQHTPQRMGFFKSAPWLVPPGIFLLLTGWLQPLVLLVFGGIFWGGQKRVVTALGLGTFLMVYASFWFTYKEPLAHIYYVLIPVVILYSFYVWEELSSIRYFRVIGILCLAASLWLWGGYIVEKINAPLSLYSNRPLVMKAIQEKNYHLLGERRSNALY